MRPLRVRTVRGSATRSSRAFGVGACGVEGGWGREIAVATDPPELIDRRPGAQGEQLTGDQGPVTAGDLGAAADQTDDPVIIEALGEQGEL